LCFIISVYYCDFSEGGGWIFVVFGEGNNQLNFDDGLQKWMGWFSAQCPLFDFCCSEQSQDCGRYCSDVCFVSFCRAQRVSFSQLENCSDLQTTFEARECVKLSECVGFVWQVVPK